MTNQRVITEGGTPAGCQRSRAPLTHVEVRGPKVEGPEARAVNTQPSTTTSNVFQRIAAYFEAFVRGVQRIPVYSSVIQHIPAYSRIKKIPGVKYRWIRMMKPPNGKQYSALLRCKSGVMAKSFESCSSISTYFGMSFRTISRYFEVFRLISGYFGLFRLISR